MDNRLQKQIVIGLIFLFFVLLVAKGAYLLIQPAPTCFDNKRNQKEEEVDCGGPCVACELKYHPPLSSSGEPIILFSKDKKVDVVFKLINLSPEWGIKQFSYKLIFKGQDGEIEEIAKTGFILPREVKYFLVPRIELNFIPKEAKIIIDKENIVWAKPLAGIDNLDNSFIVAKVRIIEAKAQLEDQKNVYTFTKTLVLGTRDAEVYNLQKVLSLNPSIYPEGEVTGYFGKLTEAAVKRFQKKYGIRITGQVGPQTRAKLHELYGPEDTEPFSYTFTKTLKKGMEGIEVLNLQQALALDSGYSPTGSISGYFDKITEEAVKRFQEKYNLPVTDEVGPQTREKLNEIFSRPQDKILKPKEEQLDPYEAKLEVKGEIYNNTPFHWKTGEVIILLCNAKKEISTAGRTPLENIYSGKNTPFSIRWHYEVEKNLNVCEKTLNINILDAENAFALR